MDNASPKSRPLALLGWLMLAGWAAFWAGCLISFRFPQRLTWVPAWDALGLDFFQNYLAVRFWHDGGNPYLQPFGDFRSLYMYPPLVLVLHAWSWPFSPVAAMTVMATLIASILTIAAIACQRVRRSLRLLQIPTPWTVLAVLVSTPAMFSMERGNCDVFALLFLLCAASALRKRAIARDALAGLLIALAAWVKIYPGVVALGLIPLGRWRASVLAFTAMAIIGLAAPGPTRAFFHNTATAENDRSAPLRDTVEWLRHPSLGPARQLVPFEPSEHTLADHASVLLQRTPVGRVPGILIAIALLVPPAAWVTRRIAKSSDGTALTLPWVLWITAVGSFLQPASFDYNLIFLVLAAVAVWDRRDGWVVHTLLGAFLVFWQPIFVPISPVVFVLCKLAGLVGVALSLAYKSRTPSPGVPGEGTRKCS